jgi:hypothetical protein
MSNKDDILVGLLLAEKYFLTIIYMRLLYFSCCELKNRLAALPQSTMRPRVSKNGVKLTERFRIFVKFRRHVVPFRSYFPRSAIYDIQKNSVHLLLYFEIRRYPVYYSVLVCRIRKKKCRVLSLKRL